MHPFSFLLLCLIMLSQPLRAAEDLVLFDFEGPADAQRWTSLELPDTKLKEPPVKLERSKEHATSGAHSLKLTFAGGTWPAVITRDVPPDWMPWQTFKADVTVSRACVVGFCVMQEGSSRAGGWDGGVSRWAKTAFLQPGKNSISAELHPNGWSALRPQLENGRSLGKVVSLEIFFYRPHEGEVIHVDNLRLVVAKEPSPPSAKTPFQVLGTDLVVGSVSELGKLLAAQWTPPETQTVAQVEARFRARHAELRRQHPAAVLAILRDGEQGFDPARPERVYSGWQDAYWSSHGPDSLTVDRSTTYGQSSTQEMFMRHRSPLMRVDLSSIPPGANILAATLLIVRAADFPKDHSPLKPNMWVAEACNRPWVETEVNAYRYAGDQHWQAIGGMNWGDHGDFLPVYLAHGPSQPGCCTWDFTHAVRFWTDGRHANHGFMLHGDSKDWFKAWFREAPKVQDRPALLVSYEVQ